MLQFGLAGSLYSIYCTRSPRPFSESCARRSKLCGSQDSKNIPCGVNACSLTSTFLDHVGIEIQQRIWTYIPFVEHLLAASLRSTAPKPRGSVVLVCVAAKQETRRRRAGVNEGQVGHFKCHC